MIHQNEGQINNFYAYQPYNKDNQKSATSFDEKFDPRNVLENRNIGSFWITTGLYP